MKWSYLLELVFEEALKSKIIRTKHGVVIYNKKDGIISTGHNRYLMDDQTIMSGKRSICAERWAIQKCGEAQRQKLKGSKILLLKLNFNNKIRYQSPCDGCQKLIDKFGLILIRITPNLARLNIKYIPYNVYIEDDSSIDQNKAILPM